MPGELERTPGTDSHAAAASAFGANQFAIILPEPPGTGSQDVAGLLNVKILTRCNKTRQLQDTVVSQNSNRRENFCDIDIVYP